MFPKVWAFLRRHKWKLLLGGSTIGAGLIAYKIWKSLKNVQVLEEEELLEKQWYEQSFQLLSQADEILTEHLSNIHSEMIRIHGSIDDVCFQLKRSRGNYKESQAVLMSVMQKVYSKLVATIYHFAIALVVVRCLCMITARKYSITSSIKNFFSLMANFNAENEGNAAGKISQGKFLDDMNNVCEGEKEGVFFHCDDEQRKKVQELLASIEYFNSPIMVENISNAARLATEELSANLKIDKEISLSNLNDFLFETFKLVDIQMRWISNVPVKQDDKSKSYDFKDPRTFNPSVGHFGSIGSMIFTSKPVEYPTGASPVLDPIDELLGIVQSPECLDILYSVGNDCIKCVVTNIGLKLQNSKPPVSASATAPSVSQRDEENAQQNSADSQEAATIFLKIPNTFGSISLMNETIYRQKQYENLAVQAITPESNNSYLNMMRNHFTYTHGHLLGLGNSFPA